MGDEGSAKNNKELLHFIAQSVSTLRQMAITVKIETISMLDISNPVVQNALSGKGINKLPALVTALNVYFGKHDIVQIYSTKMREFIDIKQQQERPKNPDEQLSSYYRDAMNDKDDDHGAIGDGDQLRKDMQKNMDNTKSTRTRIESKLAPPLASPLASPRAPPRAPEVANSREDNLILPSDELQMAKKIAKDYKQTDEDYNESDDLMLSAYWSRMAPTDAEDSMAE